MTTVYVAMIADRHTDPMAYVFTDPEVAIDYARRYAQEHAWRPDDVEEEEIDGWLYCAGYSVEGDSVWVVERTVDDPDLLGEE